MICLVCKQSMVAYFTKKTFQIERCPKCKLMAVANVPEDLAPYYAEGYFTGDVTLDGYMDYEADKEVTKKTYVGYVTAIERLLGKSEGVSMFEAGCATGFALNIAKERGWEVAGNDVSDYAVAKAQAKGLSVHVGTMESEPDTKTYDAVVMHDVIEHVKNPITTLAASARLLKPGGLLVITTPDAGSLWARVMGKRWHAFVPPQHLFYFRAAHLTKLAEEQGLEVIHTSHHGKWFAVPYILRLLYSWTGLLVFSQLARSASTSFVKKLSLPINVGDTLFWVAKKK